MSKSCNETNPLLLISSGRSGTTLMMGYLASHPGIVSCREYPLEVRIGQYFSQVANVLLERPTGNLNVHQRTIVESKPWATSNPYLYRVGADWFADEYIPRILSLMKESIQASYLEEAGRQGKEARYFAEKTVIFSKSIVTLKQMFPGYREIYLIRDPRAVIASVLNFNKKRGYDGFGIEKTGSIDEHVGNLVKGFGEFKARIERGGSNGVLVRYEDLVLRPEEELGRVFSGLGVADDAATIRKVISGADSILCEHVSSHATTASPEDSVDSWRGTLSAEYRGTIEEKMHDLLGYFRYL